MTSEKMVQVIMKLISKTNDGMINWETTDRDDEFQLSFAEYTIRLSIGQSPSNSTAPAYYVSIYNSNGQLIENVTDEDLDGYLQDSFKELRELYGAARRNALGVDKAIEDILKELEDDILPF